MASPLVLGAALVGLVVSGMAWYFKFNPEAVTTISLVVVFLLALITRKPPPPKYGKRLEFGESGSKEARGGTRSRSSKRR
jgi:hypothetical protein